MDLKVLEKDGKRIGFALDGKTYPVPVALRAKVWRAVLEFRGGRSRVAYDELAATTHSRHDVWTRWKKTNKKINKG